MTAGEAQKKLKALSSPAVAESSAWFFKTGPGQYGEGDVFIGVRVPALRTLAREYQALPLPEIESLLHSPVHEERLLALLILVRVAARRDERTRKQLYDLYLGNTKYVNNWDLVDSSAPYLVGTFLVDRSRKPLYKLAKSASLWERRIAVIATQTFIRQDDFADTLKIAALLLPDREDLIHKAVGWMLREIGKRYLPTLEAYLQEHASAMPRTMLRYAVERLPADQRRCYLARPKKK